MEVAAPGVDVLSSYNGSDSDYTTLSGTSMATPHALAWRRSSDGEFVPERSGPTLLNR